MKSKDVALSMNPAGNAASDNDRQWFRDHPESPQYIRPIVPGEFDAIALGRGDAPSFIQLNELPQPDKGKKWAVLVSVMNKDRTLRCREPLQISETAEDAPLPSPQLFKVMTPQIKQMALMLKESERAEWLKGVEGAAV
jgi:hypothetical protein